MGAASARHVPTVLGQLMDVFVFDRVRRRSRHWWATPTLPANFGQALDTGAFYSITFAHSSNARMAQHRAEIAMMDYVVKPSACVPLFVPAYGALLAGILRRVGNSAPTAAVAITNGQA